MPNKLFIQALELKLGEQTLRFCSATDISFSMEGRTAVSSAKLSELFKLSTDQLEEQTRKIGETKKSLLSILSDVAKDPDSIDRSIRELDPLIFSQDRDWRHIIQVLNEGDKEFNPIRTTVLTKYVKYLYSLEDTIGDICSDRKQSIGVPVDDNEDATWVPNQIRNGSRIGSQTGGEYKRLPNDTEVLVKLPPGERLDVRLASYKCQLVATDSNVQFIDNTKTTILSEGHNIIGRGSKSTVRIDGTQKNVSRSHLQILICDDHTLQLTDLSSAGTFIIAEFLK
jgi:tRNA(Phe) wybutosine-synthesizing methylase Tyw3